MTLLNLDAGQMPTARTVVCVGFFDGVHLGHARLIETARQVGPRVCVHTFAELPAKVLTPGAEILEITPLSVKAELLAALGVAYVAFSHFDRAMAHMQAQDFFDQILTEKLRACHIVAGFHHRFGYHSQADAASLSAMCEARGIGLSIVPPVYTGRGVLISSSAIRQAIKRGDFPLAEEMLGRAYDPAWARGDLGEQ